MLAATGHSETVRCGSPIGGPIGSSEIGPYLQNCTMPYAASDDAPTQTTLPQLTRTSTLTNLVCLIFSRKRVQRGTHTQVRISTLTASGIDTAESAGVSVRSGTTSS